MVATANLVYFIVSIIGAVKARNGVFFYFLFFGKMAYHQVYRIRPEKNLSRPTNRPPTSKREP